MADRLKGRGLKDEAIKQMRKNTAKKRVNTLAKTQQERREELAAATRAAFAGTSGDATGGIVAKTDRPPYLTDMMQVLMNELGPWDTYHDFGGGFRPNKDYDGMQFKRDVSLPLTIIENLYRVRTPGQGQLTMPTAGADPKAFLMTHMIRDPTATGETFEKMFYYYLLRKYPAQCQDPERTPINLSTILTGTIRPPTDVDTCKVVFDRGNKPPKALTPEAQSRRALIARFIHGFFFPERPDTAEHPVYYTFDAGSPYVVNSVRGLDTVVGLITPQSVADSGNTLATQLGATPNIRVFGQDSIEVVSNVYTAPRGYQMRFRNLGFNELNPNKFAFDIKLPNDEIKTIDYSDDSDRPGGVRRNGYSNGPPVNHLLACVQYLYQESSGNSTPTIPPLSARDYPNLFMKFGLATDSLFRQDLVAHQYGDLFFDIKRGGDWDQVLGALYAAISLNYVIICTEDLLCACAAWLLGANCIFSDATGLYLLKRRTRLATTTIVSPSVEAMNSADFVLQRMRPTVDTLFNGRFLTQLSSAVDTLRSIGSSSTLADTLKAILIGDRVTICERLLGLMSGLQKDGEVSSSDIQELLCRVFNKRETGEKAAFLADIDATFMATTGAIAGFSDLAPPVQTKLRAAYYYKMLYEHLPRALGTSSSYIDILTNRDSFEELFNTNQPVLADIAAAIGTLKENFPVPVSRATALKFIDPIQVLDKALLSLVDAFKQLLYTADAKATVSGLVERCIFTPEMTRAYDAFKAAKAAGDKAAARDISLEIVRGLKPLLTALDAGGCGLPPAASSAASVQSGGQRGGDMSAALLFATSRIDIPGGVSINTRVPSSDLVTTFLEICTTFGDYVTQTISNFAPYRSMEQLYNRVVDGRISAARRRSYEIALRDSLKERGIQGIDSLSLSQMHDIIRTNLSTEMSSLASVPTGNPYLNQLLANLADDDTLLALFAEMAAKWGAALLESPPANRADRAYGVITTLLNPYNETGDLKAGHPMAGRPDDPVLAAILMFALLNEYFQDRFNMRSSVVVFLTKNPSTLPAIMTDSWTWGKVYNFLTNITPYILNNFVITPQIASLFSGGGRRQKTRRHRRNRRSRAHTRKH